MTAQGTQNAQPSCAPCRRIIVASPVEPSGASWLLNCFLELGIRIDHKPVADRVWRGRAPKAERIWIDTGDRQHMLNPKAGVLMKFLPALARHDCFVFRDDVRVDYVQDFPPCVPASGEPDGISRVLMVRDPRDAIYSAYRRAAPALTFAEFLHFPNPDTLLGRASHWALFVAAWLATPAIHVVRFEDYKQDAEATLRAVLAALRLTSPDRDIENAVRYSSFEQAREAERATSERFPHDRQVANRSGTVGESQSQTEARASMPEIEAAAGSVLARLDYAAPAPPARDAFIEARLARAFLGFFETIELPAEFDSAPPDMAASAEFVFSLLALAHRLDAQWLGRAGLAPAEARALLDSLAEFARNHAGWLAGNLAATKAGFGDGSAYVFDRIRQMRQPGRTLPGAG